MTYRENFLTQALAAGCPADQTINFLKAKILLQPRQLLASAAARLCDRPDGPTAIGYGGARGGGKSHWLLAQMGADDCQRVPGLKCLLLRKVGKANIEHFEDLRRRVFGALPHEFSAYRGILTFPNGSRIIAGHFQNEKDIDAYLGLEYDIIGIEEATTLSHRKHQDITTCCRSSKSWTPQPSTFNLQPSTIPWRPRIYSTTNPGGIGHAWYRSKFVLPYLELQRRLASAAHPDVSANLPAPNKSDSFPHPNGVTHTSPGLDRGAPGAAVLPWVTSHQNISSLSPPEGERAGVRGFLPTTVSIPGSLRQYWDAHTDTIFIPARVTDNSFNNPEYQRILENLTGWQRRAWLDGDWDIAAGQFFTTFRRDIHVIPDFDESRAREWFAALDYGFTHYTVVLLGCTDSDGNTFIVDEHAERLWLPQRHAAAIKSMLTRHRVALPSSQLSTKNSQLRLSRFSAGTDVFSRQSDGTTIAHQYLREGITLKPANMDRINGWAEILQLLGDPYPPSGHSTFNIQHSTSSIPPRLFIHQRCARLAETLPTLQHDPNRPEDVLKTDADEEGNGGDDAADALRYLVATKSRTISQRKLSGL
jgi:hypothetical protein